MIKGRKKTKQQLSDTIGFLRKRIKNLLKIKPKLENKEKELKKLEETFEDRVDTRTSAERVIKRILHAEIAQRKQSGQAMDDALEYTRGIIDTIRDPLIILDADLKVISASRSFYQIFKVKPGNTEKRHIYDLGKGQWDIPKLRKLLEDILLHATSFDDFEVEYSFPVIGKRTMLLNARKIYRKTNHTQLILLAIEDVTERKALEEKLRILSNHDELTGCANFRSIMESLENEITRSRRYQKKVSIIMIDIDQLKRINDKYGHVAGNDALAVFADIIRNSVRNIDIVGRYGGDEFIIILPETDSKDALAALERIRNALKQKKIISPNENREFILQFSAGIAVFPDNAKDLKELVWVVDGALLRAKWEGKNRAVLEKRRQVRLNPSSGTRIEIVDSSSKQNAQNLKVANISKEGMLLLSTQDIFNREFLCRIHAPEEGPTFELVCKVTHKNKSESELYRIGVYFSQISESFKEKIPQCIEYPNNK